MCELWRWILILDGSFLVALILWATPGVPGWAARRNALAPSLRYIWLAVVVLWIAAGVFALRCR